SAQCAALNSAQ
ncbi:thiamine-phosphate pyrophosphorylase domain protein, partial [Vibrio parahaemolyticus V-223/04]